MWISVKTIQEGGGAWVEDDGDQDHEAPVQNLSIVFNLGNILLEQERIHSFACKYLICKS